MSGSRATKIRAICLSVVSNNQANKQTNKQLQAKTEPPCRSNKSCSDHMELIPACCFRTECSRDSPTVSGAAATGEAPESSSPASLMTPNSTPAPGAPGSPQQDYQDRAEGRGWESHQTFTLGLYWLKTPNSLQCKSLLYIPFNAH